MNEIREFARIMQHVVRDYDKLAAIAQAHRDVGEIIVVTIGSFDSVHIGHSRYLARAKSYGDQLFVGVDSDRAVKIYKDDTRPIIPEDERLEMLLHLRYVDFATVIDDVDDEGRWQYELLRAVRPDVFVAVEDSYPAEQLADIDGLVGKVVVLPRQAETSSSEIARKMMLARGRPYADALRDLAARFEEGALPE